MGVRCSRLHGDWRLRSELCPRIGTASTCSTRRLGGSAALDLGFVPGPNGKSADDMLGGGVDLLWLLGADGFDPARLAAGMFVVYQGHHGDAGAQRADVILPGAAYTEKSGTYVNTEGRPQRGFRAVYPPGEAREDWTILRAFSAVVRQDAPLRHDRSPTQADGAGQPGVRPLRLPAAPSVCSDHTGPVGDPTRAVRCTLGLVDSELLCDRSDQPVQPDHGGVRRGAVDVGRRWTRDGG